MKFDLVQRTAIIKKLQDYGIVLLDNDSTWDNFQIVDEEYFFEKLEEAEEGINLITEKDILVDKQEDIVLPELVKRFYKELLEVVE